MVYSYMENMFKAMDILEILYRNNIKHISYSLQPVGQFVKYLFELMKKCPTLKILIGEIVLSHPNFEVYH